MDSGADHASRSPAPSLTVEITNGPLAGLHGKTIRAAAGRRFVVAVDSIQQDTSVLPDGFTLVGERLA
jgi:hypothetical protein